MEPCSANDDNSEDYKDIDIFDHSEEDNYANDYKDFGVQDGWFSVKYNAEYKVCPARRGEGVGSNPKTLDPSLAHNLRL